MHSHVKGLKVIKMSKDCRVYILSIQVQVSGNKTFGPYCGRRAEFSLFSLYNTMTLEYSSNKTYSAWFVYTYTAMEYTILSYHDTPHIILEEKSRNASYLYLNIYNPVLSTIRYKTHAWLIKGNVYENVKMKFLPHDHCMATQLKYGKADVSVFEGPGYHRLLFKRTRMTCDTGKISIFTSKSFQMGFSAKLVANGELGFNAVYICSSIIASLKSTVINITEREPISLSLTDHPDCQPADYRLCVWRIQAPLGLYVMTTVKEIRHAAPDPPTCDYLGLSLLPVPQHYRYYMYRAKGRLHQVTGQDRLYPHYQHITICDLYSSSATTFKRNIVSSTTHILLFFHSYSFYVTEEYKSSIVVELSASKSQAIPIFKPESFVFLSTGHVRSTFTACQGATSGLASKQIRNNEKNWIYEPTNDPMILFRLIEKASHFLKPFGGTDVVQKPGFLALMDFESGIFCSYYDKYKMGYYDHFDEKQIVSKVPHLAYIEYRFGLSIHINVLPHIEKHGITSQNSLIFIDTIRLYDTLPSSLFSSYAIKLYDEETEKPACHNAKESYFGDIKATNSFSEFSFLYPMYVLRKPDCFYFTTQVLRGRTFQGQPVRDIQSPRQCDTLSHHKHSSSEHKPNHILSSILQNYAV